MRIEHLGIAVKDIDQAVKKFQIISPGINIEYEKSKDSSMIIAFLNFDNMQVELIQPLKKDSDVGKFIDKRGEGIHHLALEVPDILSSMDAAKENGIRLIDQSPRKGSHDNLICFLHPKDFQGILIEFCQSVQER